MAIRPSDKITERELADEVDFKLNYLGNNKLITSNTNIGNKLFKIRISLLLYIF